MPKRLDRYDSETVESKVSLDVSRDSTELESIEKKEAGKL